MRRAHLAARVKGMRQALSRQGSREQGFTLIELLAALAIASVILAAVGGLVRIVVLNFDRGTRAVSDGERLILAIERLAADFGAARFVMTPGDGSAAFIGEGARIIFVGPGGVSFNQKGEEVVGLTVEQEDDVTRLVRRSAAWPGPRTRLEDVTLGDPVTLLEGNLVISFDFGRLNDGGALAFNDGWRGQPGLPRVVRLGLRDRATGADVIAATDFVIRADASGGCGQQNPSGCGSGSADPKASQSVPKAQR
jgi:prepilin-type N-terminal cleavage/methylation domain-containing protein